MNTKTKTKTKKKVIITTKSKKTNTFTKATQKQLDYAKEVFTWMINNTKTMQKYDEFEFPDYAGMPDKLSGKLSSWTVDNIQDNWDTIKKNKSMKLLVDSILFRGW